MIQLTIFKNDGIGWSICFIYKDEESSLFSFDTEEQAIEKFHELIKLI